MSVEQPLSTFEFTQAAGTPTLPNVSQTAILFGVGTALLNTPLPYGSGPSARAAYGEARVTEIAEAHFALDTARHPIAICGTAAGVPGVLYLDTLTLLGGTSVPTADGVVTPLGDWPGVQIDVAVGGTIGTPGILLDLSIDYGITSQRIALGTATSVTFDGKGIKVNFAAGTLPTGARIAGHTDPPKWTTGELQAAMAAALATNMQWGLVGFAEPLTPADGVTISQFLNDGEAAIPRRFASVIGSKRRQYYTTKTITITATFADANPDTVTRAAGSFITDGLKPGMRVIIAGAVTLANNGTFIRVATVSALSFTMTSNVAFTNEAATANVTVVGMESNDDYAFNLASEWAGYSDSRVALTNTLERVTRPFDSAQTDQCTNGYLLSRCVAATLAVEPGKRRQGPDGGGPVAATLGGRVFENNTRVLLDAAMLPALSALPSRAVSLQTEADGRAGVFFVEARTMFPLGSPSQIKYLRQSRLVNEAKSVILSIQIDEILTGRPSDPSNPDKLSSKALSDIESAGRNALKARLKGMISNADSIDDPEGPLFAVNPATDLSTGIIICDIFLRTLFYTNGFRTTISIKAPGQ